MPDVKTFAELVLVVAGVGLAAILANRLSQHAKVPTAALLLVAAAAAVRWIPGVDAPSQLTATRLVTIALVLILFDGGMHIGWRRFSEARGPIVLLGVLGTFLTVAGAAVTTEIIVGVGWYAALLLATAISPTDPAVVFSVLGEGDVEGRAGTIIEGESGANDPVGIALMASLLSAGALTSDASVHIAGEFALEMVVGVVIGAVGGRLLLPLLRRASLPAAGLYPLFTLAAALALYGAGTLAHGSGFLAVFIAGVLVGDEDLPHKKDVMRFHSALSSLGEIVAFVTLGLTVDLDVLARTDVWLPGLVIAFVVSGVVRPIVGWLCLWPAKLTRNETIFVLFAGLKGAVPILLGTYILTSDVAHSARLYGIVVIVVVFSVVLQGSLVPAVARRLQLGSHVADEAA